MDNSNQLINKISKGIDLSFEESKTIFLSIMSGNLSENVIYDFLVNLSKKGETSEKLSKRKGNVIPLIDLVDEIGADACRFLFLSRSNESQLEFDLDLAKKQSSENPVYYVQYGHARICSILRLAKERDIEFSDGDVSILGDPTELSLINKMLELPDVIETSVENLEAHHLPHYSMELATAFHTFYQNCRVVSSKKSDLPTTKARLLLVDSARLVLGRCLDLMSMNAPDEM